MIEFTDQQKEEIDFWKWLVRDEGDPGFYVRRNRDFHNHCHNLGGFADFSGKGLEVGTGCFSMLEWAKSDYKITSIDPLNFIYKKLLKRANKNVETMTFSGEDIPFNDNSFDWLVCWNVIDHTPRPAKMAAEMYRVLKPGGLLMFEVNFDDQLQKPHHSLWNKKTVEIYFSSYDLIFEKLVPNPADNQSLYYAVFKKP